jgi:hypothetical protein
VQIPAVFYGQTGALKELKALKAYPTFWWWRRGTDNPGAKPGKTDDGGEGSAPLESALSTNQLSKIRCASPKAEEATKCYVEDRAMLFRSTLLQLYRYSLRGLVLTKFALKRAFGEDLDQFFPSTGCRERAPQISPLRSPGFPVEFCGVDGVLAALFTESRTRGRLWGSEVGNPGTLRSR